MAKSNKKMMSMREIHRYLGFFLAGIMAVYAISGILLIFRDTDFLKSERSIERNFDADFKTEYLGKALQIRDFKITKEDTKTIYFAQGSYDKTTRTAKFTAVELPVILDKMTHLHKASTKEPLFFLNIFFGMALLFFVISSFYMFMPSSSIFKKGLYFTLAGVILTLILVFS